MRPVLADSTRIKASLTPPQGTEAAKLYVNQLVSSRLNWRTHSVVMNMQADMYAPGNGRRGWQGARGDVWWGCSVRNVV